METRLLRQIRAEDSRVAELEAENARLRKVLKRIATWQGEFPASGKKWPDGRPMSYGAAFGSNGERDFMRALALAAVELANRELFRTLERTRHDR